MLVTAIAGNVSPEAKRLCQVTRQALDSAISICKPGVPYKEIGRVGCATSIRIA